MLSLTIQKFCTCIELWKGCVLAGIFSMTTSIFDLLRSIAHMLDERNPLVFYLLFTLGIESVLFIASSGLLFIGLVKKSKILLTPWMIFAIIDIIMNFIIAFVELASPERTFGSPCILPIADFAVTILVCAVLLYCLLCVYAQYFIYVGKRNGGIIEIKVSPATDNVTNRAHSAKNSINEEMPIQETNILSLPQVSTPRDAW